MAPTSTSTLGNSFRATRDAISGRVFVCFKYLVPLSLLRGAAAQKTGSSDAVNMTLINQDVNYITTLFNFTDYRNVGKMIRAGNKLECFGNLSIALLNTGPITAASNGGSSGALTLLPTAGALIGAPAKELWMLYKLVPIAGMLSMLLSLGGNILPNASGDYETHGYRYDGIIGSNMDEDSTRLLSVKKLGPKTFADVVQARADNPLGGTQRFTIGFGMLCQLAWIGIIIFACWFTEQGSVVVWWCQAWGWMLGWYLIVALSSLLENSALVPFTNQWTLRISKAPSGIHISNDAPSVLPFLPTKATSSNSDPDIELAERDTNGSSLTAHNNSSGPLLGFGDSHGEPALDRRGTNHTMLSQKSVVEQYRDFVPPMTRQRSEFLHNLQKHGLNTTGRVYIDPTQPWAANNRSFMVIISVSGVSHTHAALRVGSKAISVGVFAAGTALFASASLITISVALTVLCLILGAGVFGRVASMWMVAQLMKENPVIHRVVSSETEADRFIHEILAKDGLTVELVGHVFINGKCVKRYSRWLNWTSIFGILASPYNVEKLMVKLR